VPYYMQLVPDLQFVEKSLKFYEQFFETKIYRVLHPNFYRTINNDRYQPPDRVGVIEQLSLPIYGFDDVSDGVKRTAGIENSWQVIGTRKAESILRAKRMSKDGYTVKRKTAMPIMDWRKDDVIACLKNFKCPLPVDYKLFGRSFDDLYARYLVPIQEHYPEDFERIKFWYPMVELEIARWKMGVAHGII